MNSPSAGLFHLFKFMLIIWLLLCSGKLSQSLYASNDAIIVEADKTGIEGQGNQSINSSHNEPLFKTPIQMFSFCSNLNEVCCSKMNRSTAAASDTPRISRAIDVDKLKCGAGPYDTPNKIVGEIDAIKNSWPGMVALVLNNQQFCGGTLIDSMHVVTAAHCVADMTPRNVAQLRVALGMHALKPKMDAEIFKKVWRVSFHRNFNIETYYNDIALLTMESPVTFTRTISPVCLPPISLADQYANRDAVTIGWGVPIENGTQPNVLQQVTIEIFSNSECRSIYKGVVRSGIADHMLCAAYPGIDTCSGDSGGPLFVQSTPGDSWIQVGIVSWGVGCADPEFPGVYTRISSFVGWINKHAVGRPS